MMFHRIYIKRKKRIAVFQNAKYNMQYIAFGKLNLHSTYEKRQAKVDAKYALAKKGRGEGLSA